VGKDDAVLPLTEGDRAPERALGLVAPACPAMAELRFAEAELGATPTSKIRLATSRSLRTVSRSVSMASPQKRSARRSPSAIRGLDKIR
jgi:hypothetical protein